MTSGLNSRSCLLRHGKTEELVSHLQRTGGRLGKGYCLSLQSVNNCKTSGIPSNYRYGRASHSPHSWRNGPKTKQAPLVSSAVRYYRNDPGRPKKSGARWRRSPLPGCSGDGNRGISSRCNCGTWKKNTRVCKAPGTKSPAKAPTFTTASHGPRETIPIGGVTPRGVIGRPQFPRRPEVLGFGAGV